MCRPFESGHANYDLRRNYVREIANDLRCEGFGYFIHQQSNG